MKKLLLLISIIQITLLQGQVKFATDPIKDSIRFMSNSVVRDYYTEIEFIDEENYVIRKRKLVTVLNRRGIEEGNFVLADNERAKFKFKEAKTSNADGITLRVFTENDIYKSKLVNISEEVLENLNFYSLKMNEDVFPYNTYFDYEMIINGTLKIDDWVPNPSSNSGLENAELKIILKPEMQINIKINGNIKQMKNDSSKRSKYYYWKALPQKSRVQEDTAFIIPSLRMTLTKFKLLGSTGSFNSWQSFGNWIVTLNEGLYALPADLEKMVSDTVAKYNSDSLIIQALYSYIQKEYRYVSIQLGIGGWKPQSNEFTFKKGIGDCKALSLMMKSLLDKAGIESYYCLASMKREKEIIYQDFPENRFNHVMICAILNGKNHWIECTSKDLIAGQSSLFCKGTYSLIVSKDNSKLLKID